MVLLSSASPTFSRAFLSVVMVAAATGLPAGSTTRISIERPGSVGTCQRLAHCPKESDAELSVAPHCFRESRHALRFFRRAAETVGFASAGRSAMIGVT